MTAVVVTYHPDPQALHVQLACLVAQVGRVVVVAAAAAAAVDNTLNARAFEAQHACSRTRLHLTRVGGMAG